MEKYIGTKIINAKPMNRDDYNALRNFPTPANGSGADEGYLVEYTDGGKPNLEGFSGYVSWSPKEQFEKAYRTVENMTFGLATEALKRGKKVARTGWNGKGMYLELQIPDENSKMTLPYIYMKTADDKLVPWLASQTDVLTDVLAEDWAVVE